MTAKSLNDDDDDQQYTRSTQVLQSAAYRRLVPTPLKYETLAPCERHRRCRTLCYPTATVRCATD